MTTHIAVLGAAGRMGRRIIALSQEQEGAFTLSRAIEHHSSPHIGEDAGQLANVQSLDVNITNQLAFGPDDVVIDFTLPDALEGVIEAALEAKCSLVCGTTGLEGSHKQQLAKAAETIPVLYSPNMSVGVNLVFLIARSMAQMVPELFDIEVFEKHHKHKRDAPSGTAIRLAEMLAEGRNQVLSEVARMSREGADCARVPGEIGIQTLRGGDIAGEHTAFFCGPGERIELTHRATSRDIFARGALQAAAWLNGKEPGLYSMFDVLALDNA